MNKVTIKFIQTSTENTLEIPLISKYSTVSLQVKNAKNKEEWRLEYMTLLQRDLQNREEGRAEGRAEERMQIVFNMYSIGMTPEKIAELTLLPLEEVLALLKER